MNNALPRFALGAILPYLAACSSGGDSISDPIDATSPPSSLTPVATQWGPGSKGNDIISFEDQSPDVVGDRYGLYLPLAGHLNNDGGNWAPPAEAREGFAYRTGSDLANRLNYEPRSDPRNEIVEGVIWYEHFDQHPSDEPGDGLPNHFVVFGTWVDEDAAGGPQLYAFYGSHNTVSRDDHIGQRSGTAAFTGNTLGFYQAVDGNIYRTHGDAEFTFDIDALSIRGVLDNFRIEGKGSPETWILELLTTSVGNRDNASQGLFGFPDRVVGSGFPDDPPLDQEKWTPGVTGDYRGRLAHAYGDNVWTVIGSYDASGYGMRLVGAFGAME